MNTEAKTTDGRVASHVDLVEHCEKTAQFYCEKPGLVQAATTIDIYHCLADLAQEVKDLRRALEKAT